jgi:hypothetical protein
MSMGGYFNALVRASGQASTESWGTEKATTGREAPLEVQVERDAPSFRWPSVLAPALRSPPQGGHASAASLSAGPPIRDTQSINDPAPHATAIAPNVTAIEPYATAIEPNVTAIEPLATALAPDDKHRFAEQTPDFGALSSRVSGKPRTSARAEQPDALRSIALPATTEQPIPQGIDIVRAAMRWISADPALTKRVPAIPAHAMQPSRRIAPQTQQSKQNEMAPEARSDEAMQPSPRTHLLAALAVPVVGDSPSVPLRHAQQSTTATKLDSVEVSIGAIHIKVDPPAVQAATQARSSAPRRPAASPIAPRPSLARRSLRRL